MIDSQGLHILQHSLGLNQFGLGKSYRNRFVTGPGCTSFDTCLMLAEAGLMVRMTEWENDPLCGGSGASLFMVTEKGRDVVALKSPAPPPLPKLTRGQKRYREYLHSDCGLSFGEWLRGRA